MKIKKYNIYILLYTLFAFFIFSIFISDDYFTNYFYRFDADAVIYVEIVDRFDDYKTLIGLTHSSIGPTLILLLTENNNLTVFFFNISLLILIFIVVFKSYKDKINKLKFTLLFLINPLLLGSLLTVNKEIIGLLSVAILACYLKTNNKFYFILSLILSFITRWQCFFVFILFYLINSRFNPLRNERFKFIILFCIILSAIFPMLSSILSNEIYSIDEQGDKLFGILEFFYLLQDNYLYILAVIPKMLSNLFGNIFRIFTIITNPDNIDFTDVYNKVFILGHQLVMFFMVIYFMIKKKLGFKSDLFYFAIFYLIIFSLSPSIQYRYMYPLYVLFCIILSLKPINQPINK
jgi:hypothetical protein